MLSSTRRSPSPSSSPPPQLQWSDEEEESRAASHKDVDGCLLGHQSAQRDVFDHFWAHLENPSTSSAETDEPVVTGTEVVFLSTLPPGVPLAEAIMPRRRREKILEITKTVTVTEVVSAAADKHPRGCEVTLTNLDQAAQHPVSVRISQLQTKDVRVEEKGGKGVISNGHVVEMLEQDNPPAVYSRTGDGREFITTSQYRNEYASDAKQRPQTPDTTFNRSSDNVIDLSFTQPLRDAPKNEGEERRFVAYTRRNMEPTKLYYRPFIDTAPTATKDAVLHIDLNLLSPSDSVLQQSSPGRGALENDETSSLSSDGSVLVHDVEHREDSGVSSTDNMYRPVVKSRNRNTSSETSDDSLEYAPRTETTLTRDAVPPVRPPRPERPRSYIVTGVEESGRPSSQSANLSRSYIDLPIDSANITSVSMNDSIGERSMCAGITSVSMNDSDGEQEHRRRDNSSSRAPDNSSRASELIAEGMRDIERVTRLLAGGQHEDAKTNGQIIEIYKTETTTTKREFEDVTPMHVTSARVESGRVGGGKVRVRVGKETTSEDGMSFGYVVRDLKESSAPPKPPRQSVPIIVELPKKETAVSLSSSKKIDEKIQEAVPVIPPRKREEKAPAKVEAPPRKKSSTVADPVAPPRAKPVTSNELETPAVADQQKRNSKSEAYEDFRRQVTNLRDDVLATPPNMTSTPMTTLERKHVKEQAEENQEPKRPSRKGSRPGNLVVPTINMPPQEDVISPLRRPASSPIVVVNQSRKSSVDHAERRKSTVTDIDWFAAFNMKEPTTPRTPRSPLMIDVLKENEKKVNELPSLKHTTAILRRNSVGSLDIAPPASPPPDPLIPCAINLDDVLSCIATNAKDANKKHCHCNACRLTKLSDEERLRLIELAKEGRSQQRRRYTFVEGSRITKETESTPPANISIDEIFSPPKATTRANTLGEPSDELEDPAVDISLVTEVIDRRSDSIETSSRVLDILTRARQTLEESYSSKTYHRKISPSRPAAPVLTEAVNISLTDIFTATTVDQKEPEEEHHHRIENRTESERESVDARSSNLEEQTTSAARRRQEEEVEDRSTKESTEEVPSTSSRSDHEALRNHAPEALSDIQPVTTDEGSGSPTSHKVAHEVVSRTEETTTRADETSHSIASESDLHASFTGDHHDQDHHNDDGENEWHIDLDSVFEQQPDSLQQRPSTSFNFEKYTVARNLSPKAPRRQLPRQEHVHEQRPVLTEAVDISMDDVFNSHDDTYTTTSADVTLEGDESTHEAHREYITSEPSTSADDGTHCGDGNLSDVSWELNLDDVLQNVGEFDCNKVPDLPEKYFKRHSAVHRQPRKTPSFKREPAERLTEPATIDMEDVFNTSAYTSVSRADISELNLSVDTLSVGSADSSPMTPTHRYKKKRTGAYHLPRYLESSKRWSVESSEVSLEDVFPTEPTTSTTENAAEEPNQLTERTQEEEFTDAHPEETSEPHPPRPINIQHVESEWSPDSIHLVIETTTSVEKENQAKGEPKADNHAVTSHTTTSINLDDIFLSTTKAVSSQSQAAFTEVEMNIGYHHDEPTTSMDSTPQQQIPTVSIFQPSPTIVCHDSQMSFAEIDISDIFVHTGDSETASFVFDEHNHYISTSTIELSPVVALRSKKDRRPVEPEKRSSYTVERRFTRRLSPLPARHSVHDPTAFQSTSAWESTVEVPLSGNDGDEDVSWIVDIVSKTTVERCYENHAAEEKTTSETSVPTKEEMSAPDGDTVVSTTSIELFKPDAESEERTLMKEAAQASTSSDWLSAIVGGASKTEEKAIRESGDAKSQETHQTSPTTETVTAKEMSESSKIIEDSHRGPTTETSNSTAVVPNAAPTSESDWLSAIVAETSTTKLEKHSEPEEKSHSDQYTPSHLDLEETSDAMHHTDSTVTSTGINLHVAEDRETSNESDWLSAIIAMPSEPAVTENAKIEQKSVDHNKEITSQQQETSTPGTEQHIVESTTSVEQQTPISEDPLVLSSSDTDWLTAIVEDTATTSTEKPTETEDSAVERLISENKEHTTCTSFEELTISEAEEITNHAPCASKIEHFTSEVRFDETKSEESAQTNDTDWLSAIVASSSAENAIEGAETAEHNNDNTTEKSSHLHHAEPSISEVSKHSETVVICHVVEHLHPHSITNEIQSHVDETNPAGGTDWLSAIVAETSLSAVDKQVEENISAETDKERTTDDVVTTRSFDSLEEPSTTGTERSSTPQWLDAVFATTPTTTSEQPTVTKRNSFVVVAEVHKSFDREGVIEPKTSQEWISSLVSDETEAKEELPEVSSTTLPHVEEVQPTTSSQELIPPASPTTESAKNAEELLMRVFSSSSRVHVESEDCQCHACMDSRLSPEELEEKWRRIEERRAAAAAAAVLTKREEADSTTTEISSHHHQHHTQRPLPTSDIALEEVFHPKKSSATRVPEKLRTSEDIVTSTTSFTRTYDVTSMEGERSTAATRRRASGINLDAIFPARKAETTGDETKTGASCTWDIECHTTAYTQSIDELSDGSRRTDADLSRRLPPTTTTTKQSDEDVMTRVADAMIDELFRSTTTTYTSSGEGGESGEKRSGNSDGQITNNATAADQSTRTRTTMLSVGSGYRPPRRHYNEYYDEDDDQPSVPSQPQPILNGTTSIHARRHVNDFYDEEPEFSLEENIDVKDFVDDILSQSLTEAAFLSASQDRLRDFHASEDRRTDTSYDRKKTPPSQSPSVALDLFKQEHEEIAGAVPEPMEEEELSAAATAIASSFLQHRDSFESSFLASIAAADQKSAADAVTPAEPHATEVQCSEISSSGVKVAYDEQPTTSTTFSSSGDVLNLVFTKRKSIDSVGSEDEPWKVDTYVVEEKTITTLSDRGIERRKSMEIQNNRLDEEMLEVEDNEACFVIKGNYSIVINKSDPLGDMLQKLQEETGHLSSLDFTVAPKLRKLLYQCLRDKAHHVSDKSCTLSTRARELLGTADPAYEVYREMQANQFSSTNKQGNVNLCTAVNCLCEDLLAERFKETPQMFVPENEHIVNYGPAGGYEKTKSAVVSFFREFHNANLLESEMVLMPSTNTAYDVIAHCMFESGDVILNPYPTYARAITNLADRAECRVEGVALDLDNPTLDITQFEQHLKVLHDKGDSVRAVLLINPHNPLGVIFTKDDVIGLCNWAASNNLYTIIDESFAECVHGDNVFESFASYRGQLRQPDMAILMWSFSKGFGVPGTKMGMLYTSDRRLQSAAARLEIIHPVSSLAMDFAVQLLCDSQWIKFYMANLRQRLTDRYHFVTENLAAMGIPFVPAQSGIFVYADFRKWLSEQTISGEEDLWRRLREKGIFVTLGQHTKCPTPGWMRVVFAAPKEELIEGISRLHVFVGSTTDVIGTVKQ